MTELEKDVEKLALCKNFEEFLEASGLSPSSPEAYWAEVAWRVAHATGFQCAWEQKP